MAPTTRDPPTYAIIRARLRVRWPQSATNSREEVHFRAFHTCISLPDFAIARFTTNGKSARIKSSIDTMVIRKGFTSQSLSKNACRSVYDTMQLLWSTNDVLFTLMIFLEWLAMRFLFFNIWWRSYFRLERFYSTMCKLIELQRMRNS